MEHGWILNLLCTSILTAKKKVQSKQTKVPLLSKIARISYNYIITIIMTEIMCIEILVDLLL